MSLLVIEFPGSCVDFLLSDIVPYQTDVTADRSFPKGLHTESCPLSVLNLKNVP